MQVRGHVLLQLVVGAGGLGTSQSHNWTTMNVFLGWQSLLGLQLKDSVFLLSFQPPALWDLEVLSSCCPPPGTKFRIADIPGGMHPLLDSPCDVSYVLGVWVIPSTIPSLHKIKGTCKKKEKYFPLGILLPLDIGQGNSY